MTRQQPNVQVGGVASEIAEQAARLGITADNCLFCARTDLALDGRSRAVWLVVTDTQLVTLAADAVDQRPISGPFDVASLSKVRMFQAVGGSVLQVLIDGYYADVLRHSNACRERFGRVRTQLERLIEQRPLQLEALVSPSEVVCQRCDLPLPGRGAACPRCENKHGLLVRSFGLMRPYYGAISLLLLMMVVGVGLDLIPPQLTRILVDRVILPQENLNWLVIILLSLVLASAARTVLQILIGRVSASVGTQITRSLREQLQIKLMSLSVDYYDRQSVGSLMSRVLYDVDYFQGFVQQVAQGFLLNVMLVLGIGTMLFTMSWELALLVLLPIPFVVLGTIFFWRHIYPRYYRLWDSQSKMAQLLSGLLSGVRLVKSFGQEERERERFGQAAGYMRETRRMLEAGMATFNPIMGFVFGLGGLLIWYAGGHRVLEGRMTLGVLMAFFTYLGMFYGPISAISMFSNWISGFLSSAQRVYEILDAQVALTPSGDVQRFRTCAGQSSFVM
ncbi:MAG: ABC transporter transmembrane domain-containing protein [Verrucomicrobia bacterium]|nr:ABC transporter transmembrane domain-containing protein [Verrucomicrobiota bacterium]